jgi:RNA polymerase sigma factor (sigma-70 family)
MTDDTELLRRYADERSEEAFAELVRRHLGLVYHAALRQCGGDAHRAEDVAQTVFTDLARKARSLGRHPGLAGWLYTGTRHAAAQAVRTEVRRQARESEAQVNAELAADPTADWEQLRPVIDDVLQALGEADREAVLLRFFEERPFAEIGARLAVSEDAARMRVDRALEKMRGRLARRGLTSTTAALALALATQAGAAVPAGLAASISGAALTAAAVGGTTALVTFMSLTKLQIGAALALAAAATTGLVLQHQSNLRLRAEVASLSAQVRSAAPAPPPPENPAVSPAELATLRREHAELLRLRASAAPAAPAKSKIAGEAPLAAGLTPVLSLGNAGRATPRATFATQLWAARTGNVELEATALAFSPEARAKLQALAATLPASFTAEYDTPEKLMAFVLSGSPHPVQGMQVLDENDNGPDDTTLQTTWQHADDTIVHHSEVQLHRDTDGWKWVVPVSLVDRAAAYLTRTAPTGPGGK